MTVDALPSGNSHRHRAGEIRPLLQFCRGAVGDDLAAIDDDRARTSRLDFLEDVGRKNDRLCSRPSAGSGAHFVLLVRIEAVGRFVQNQHVRIVDDRLGEAGAVTVTFRERFDALVHDRLEKTHFDHAIDRRFLASPRETAQLGGEIEETRAPSCRCRTARSPADNR